MTKSPVSQLKRLSTVLFTLYAFLVFLVFMLVLFPLILLVSPLGKMRGGNLVYSICRFWARAFCILTGIRHRKILRAPHDRSRPFIFVSNHISYMDIPMMMRCISHQHIRILGKAEMARIPIFGFIYRIAVVLVYRDDAAHRLKSIRILRSVIRRGVSVFICPEGTFNTTHQPLKEFYDGAFRIAIETQTPIKPILFLDTYDRLPYTSFFSFNPGRCRTVFLKEVEVDGYTLKDTQALKEKVYTIMEEALIGYRASWIE